MSAKLTFEQIGGRLREAREASGFTQTDVEEMVGINRVTLSNIERGKNKIDSLLLKKLAELYGYSIMYFLEEPEHFHELDISYRKGSAQSIEKEGINWAKKILFNYQDLQEIRKEGKDALGHRTRS